jgi:hypothetical protein
MQQQLVLLALHYQQNQSSYLEMVALFMVGFNGVINL